MLKKNASFQKQKSSKSQEVIGVIAGWGALPPTLVNFCIQTGKKVCVLGLKGHAKESDFPTQIPVKFIRLGSVGKAFRFLKAQKVTDIVMIGAVRRASLSEICPDFKGWRFFAKIGMRALGDDGLLRAVIHEVESEGFRVRGIQEFMPQLLMPKGVLTAQKPTKKDWVDIQRGIETASLLGQADVGQAVIVQQGLVLSLEGIEGTKALIERTKALVRKGGGGVLVKMLKPTQDKRVDMPTIGPDTVQSVADSGLKGIAVQAESVLIAHIDETIKLANKLGIFIVGV